jgi:8-hydroxy-5-deazaflavin:NADPH oxidoreductase
MAALAILGYGKIGGTLGRKWRAAGHSVVFGVRDPNKPDLRKLCNEIGAYATTVEEAAQNGDVVTLAVPGAAVTESLTMIGSTLEDKIVIDVANNVRGEVMNSVSAVRAVAPSASYFRAFNTVGWEILDQPQVGGIQADMFFCGPNGDPRATVERLASDVGLRPVWVGGPEEVDVVDGMLRIWFTLVMKRGRGRRLAFKMLEG